MTYQKTAFQILIAGGKGQGKSALTDATIKSYSFNRVFVFDVLGEYAAKGYATVSNFRDMMALVKRGWKKGFRIAYVPSRADMPKQLSYMSEVICKIQQPYKDTPDGKTPPQPKVLFVVEEMRWSYPQNCPHPWFAEITTLGRHYGVDVIGTTQRIAEVSTNYRGTCDMRFFFAQEEHADVSTIAKYIGPKNIPHLKALQPHQYLRLYRGRLGRGQNRLK